MSVHLGTGCLITNSKGEYLLIQEAKKHVKGKWNLPMGGYSREDEAYEETIREAAVREVKEETGLDVELDGLIGIYTRDAERADKKNTNIIFEASKIGGELSPKKVDEIQDAQFFSFPEIKQLDLRFDILKIIEDYIDEGSFDTPVKPLEF